MSTYIRFLFEFMSVFFKGIGMIVGGFFKGILQLFNIQEYMYVIEFYRSDLNVAEWILVVVAVIIMFIVLALIILLIVLVGIMIVRFFWINNLSAYLQVPYFSLVFRHSSHKHGTFFLCHIPLTPATAECTFYSTYP